MGRKKVERKVDNLDIERSEEIPASNSEWDVSNTLNYIQHIVNTIWLIWVYIKIILKLVAFLFIKTKSQNDEIASSVKTDVGAKLLRLNDKHFPNSNPLNKVVNRKNTKVSYRTTSNIKKKIT